MHNQDTSVSILFITLGCLLLLGLAADFVGRRTSLPRVSLLILFGFTLGPGGLALLPGSTQEWMPLVANVALLLVGFLLGGKLTRANTLENGTVVLCVSISVVVITLVCVVGGLVAAGVPVALALLLGGIATATDPATTVDAIRETGARGRFTDTLQGIVAIDDAWGLLAFTLVLALANLLTGTDASWEVAVGALWELGGAVLLGVVLGVPMAWMSGRIRPGQPTLLEALGMVLLCGGLAHYLEVSYLLAAMTMGTVVCNFARHHDRAFHEIEGIEWPYMVLFFTLTGASLTLSGLASVGPVAVVYILCRLVGRYIGCWPGAVLSGAIPSVRIWMGGALLPQAGVAMGMALIAASEHPQLADTVIPVVILATVFFELAGPVCASVSLRKSGDVRPAAPQA
jgi:Kef-type K+ transport system membrane component KefB